ncbi:10910_t:CDS:1, partial [Funneliformis geosporum]
VSEWIALWTPPETNFYNLPYPGQTIVGKSFKSLLFSDKILFQYFVLYYISTDSRSPSKKQNMFVACTG